MRYKAIALAATAIICASALFAASPAATQKWVQDYVATHGGGSSGVSMEWVIDYVRTNAAPTAATAAQDERKELFARKESALTISMFDAIRTGLYALEFSYSTPSNGLESVKMAERNGGGWTNVVYWCGISTNTEHEAVLVFNELDYNCSTFSNYTARNEFVRIDGDVTNIIEVVYVAVTTNDYKIAKGEN